MSEILLCYVAYNVDKWNVRIDGSHGPPPHQKHVHLTRKRLKGKYSWNVDGSRHDKHRFPVSEQQITRAKELAADALGVPAHTLQLLTTIDGGCSVSFRAENKPVQPRSIGSTYVRVNERLILIGAPNGGLLGVTSLK